MPRPEEIIGLSAVVLIFGTPMVAVLLRHQRRMAELIHARPAPSADTEVLRNEIRELKALVHQQSIAIDRLARPTADAPIHERVR